VLPFKASPEHTRWRLPYQCGPGQTSCCCLQSWCLCGRWDVNEIPYISCCCIVFQSNAPDPFYTKIATSLVHSWIDYCIAVFADLPAHNIRRLQSVQNLSIQLVTGARKYDHVTLRDHHWLPIVKRIDYKLCPLVYPCLQGNAPGYLADHDVLHRLKERLAICGHFHSGSADNCAIVGYADRAFSFAGPHAWNSLPINVHCARSM